MKYIILFFLGITFLLSSCSPYAAQSDVIIQQGGSQNIIENITYNNITNITSFNITNITSYNITNITTNNITNISSYNANLSIFRNGSFFNNITELNFIGRGWLLQDNGTRLNLTNQGLEVKDEGTTVTNTTAINFIGSSVSAVQNGNQVDVTVTSSGGSTEPVTYWNYSRRNAYISVLGTGAAFGTIGDSATITGTGSTPTINRSAGLQQNIVTPTTTPFIASVSGNTIWDRDFNTFMKVSWRRVEITNGSRIFVGLTTNTMANQLLNDQPTGDYIGIMASNTRWTNYAIVSSNGTNVFSFNTTLAFTNADVMNATININTTGCSVIFNNVETIVSPSSGCPRTAQALRYGIALSNTTVGAQNIRVSRIFISAER